LNEAHERVVRAYETVVDQLAIFANVFSEDPNINGYITRVEIPKYTGSVEVSHRQHIQVNPIERQGIPLEALDAYTNLYQKKGLSNRYSYRMPGIIQVSDATIHQATVVNHAKDYFRAAMQSIPKGSRARFRDEILSHSLNLTYVNRDIPIIGPALEKIKFQWEGKSFVQTKLSRFQAAELVRKGSPLTSSLEQGRDIGEMNMKTLANLPHSCTIIQRRPGAPSVYANAKLMGGAWLPKMRCALPIMTSQTLPGIDRLVEFAEAGQPSRNRRSNAKEYMDLIPALNLYYIEAAR
jgi:hypothetical protein